MSIPIQPARLANADLARALAYLQAMSLLKQGNFTLVQAVK